MITWLLTVLTVGAVLRFTRLVNKDTILEPARQVVQGRAVAAEERADAWRLENGWTRPLPWSSSGDLVWAGEGPEPSLPGAYRRRWRGGFWPWLDDLIGCPWCVSVYVSLPTAVVVVWWGDNRVVIAGLLACTASWVAGVVTAKTEEENE
jgi:hypothetical protein